MRTLALLSLTTAVLTLADDSFNHAAKASDGASGVVGNLTASGVEAAVGASAIPVILAGGVSVVAGGSAAVTGSAVANSDGARVKSTDESVTQTWGPLKVDDKVVVAPDPAPRSADCKTATR